LRFPFSMKFSKNCRTLPFLVYANGRFIEKRNLKRFPLPYKRAF
jgi:hypothetical protein